MTFLPKVCVNRATAGDSRPRVGGGGKPLVHQINGNCMNVNLTNRISFVRREFLLYLGR